VPDMSRRPPAAPQTPFLVHQVSRRTSGARTLLIGAHRPLLERLEIREAPWLSAVGHGAKGPTPAPGGATPRPVDLEALGIVGTTELPVIPVMSDDPEKTDEFESSRMSLGVLPNGVPPSSTSS